MKVSQLMTALAAVLDTDGDIPVALMVEAYKPSETSVGFGGSVTSIDVRNDMDEFGPYVELLCDHQEIIK